jgi:hypothetical protein
MRRLKESVCERQASAEGQRGTGAKERRTRDWVSSTAKGATSSWNSETSERVVLVRASKSTSLDSLRSSALRHSSVHATYMQRIHIRLTLDDPADVGHHACADVLVAHELGEGDGGLDADGKVGVGDALHNGAEGELEVLLCVQAGSVKRMER